MNKGILKRQNLKIFKERNGTTLDIILKIEISGHEIMINVTNEKTQNIKYKTKF